jgi:hypothetical protein
MPFEPGKSGNPGGRPAEVGIVKRLARENTEKAVRRLVEWIDSENPKASVAACNSILDRGWGKPAQAIIGGNADDPPIRVEGISIKLIRPDAT